MPRTIAFAFAMTVIVQAALAQGPGSVLLVINDSSPVSRNIGEYYARKRAIPAKNICRIRTAADEGVVRAVYDKEIAEPISECLIQNALVEQVFYIVTTLGVPLLIRGREAMDGDIAAVDSELAMLYGDIYRHGPHPLNGMQGNPFFNKRDAKFGHPQFPIYMVARLAAYDFQGVRAMIDKSLVAKNQGKIVLDMKSAFETEGNSWLAAAANALPKDRVILDRSATVLYEQKDVIAYAGWGSNDTNRKERFTRFKWLPGSIATEFVSTDGRTFERPPENWTISDWNSRALWFKGSPQSLTADYLLEGATAATGHVAEPYLAATPRPEILLPAYIGGRNLGESFYLSIPYLSWQNILVGDPLTTLGRP